MSDLPSWAKVGAKVVCINFTSGAIVFVPNKPYTISGNDGEFLHFEEPETRPKGCEGMWFPHRFRPLIIRTQDEDVAAFKSLLQDMPLTERLDRIGELLGER